MLFRSSFPQGGAASRAPLAQAPRWRHSLPSSASRLLGRQQPKEGQRVLEKPAQVAHSPCCAWAPSQRYLQPSCTENLACNIEQQLQCINALGYGATECAAEQDSLCRAAGQLSRLPPSWRSLAIGHCGACARAENTTLVLQILEAFAFSSRWNWGFRRERSFVD